LLIKDGVESAPEDLRLSIAEEEVRPGWRVQYHDRSLLLLVNRFEMLSNIFERITLSYFPRPVPPDLEILFAGVEDLIRPEHP
jgi:hypothetical protein